MFLTTTWKTWLPPGAPPARKNLLAFARNAANLSCGLTGSARIAANLSTEKIGVKDFL